MEDIDGTDDAAETPASPEPEESSAPEETAAAEGDAQADDTQGDDSAEDGDEGKTEQGPGGAFDKLLAKYGGDKEKMAAAYFEQANSNSRLWEKLQGIEEYIKGSQTAARVDTEALVAGNPDVKEIAQEYQDTQAEIQSVAKKQDRLIAQYGEMEKQIAKLEGQLERAYDDAKPEIREALREAKAEQKDVRAQIDRSQDKVKSLSADLKRLTRDYKEARARAEVEVSRQRQAELERQEAAQQTRREFAEAMRSEAGRYGIAVESKQYAVLFQSINDRIYSYLSRLPEGSPGVDIDGAVQALMAEYAETLGLKARFHKASDAKRAATSAGPKTTLPAPKGKPAEVAPPKDGRWTKAFVEDRARRLLGG